jgi:hypothetical protein
MEWSFFQNSPSSSFRAVTQEFSKHARALGFVTRIEAPMTFVRGCSIAARSAYRLKFARPVFPRTRVPAAPAFIGSSSFSPCILIHFLP